MAKAKSGFEKFINPEVKGAKKKEQYRSDKRKAKAEARAAGNAFRAEKKAKQQGWDRDAFTGPKRPAAKAFAPKGKDDFKREKEDLRNWADDFVGGKKPAAKAAPKASPGRTKTGFDTDRPAPRSRPASDRSARPTRSTDERPAPRSERPTSSRPSSDRPSRPSRSASTEKFAAEHRFTKPPANQKAAADNDWAQKRMAKKSEPFAAKTAPAKAEFEEMPLNKFIAHSGVCGRREAAAMVKAGKATVNGDVVYEPGYKVSEKDNIKLAGKKLHIQKALQYILLNKPKDYITTLKDPEGRKTVLDLVKDAAQNRIYPVGRLDRNTTGVLLLTNDGELAQKLTHPSFQVKKIYEVKLDKPLAKADFEQVLKGVELEDGVIAADSIAYADAKDKSIVGIEIHSGKNRVVRRLFEKLGYDVRNLDRVMFANLTKKAVERGTWRFLKEKEIRNLKFLNSSFVKKEA